jgi:biopolymer transport protein ExbD
MAGAAPVQANTRGKKSLDLELNLVPFIDLLSCLISFLLITAVWTRVSAVPAQSTGNLAGALSETHPVRVSITSSGYTLAKGAAPVLIPKSMRDGHLTFDTTALTVAMRKIDHSPTDRAVTIASEDGVAYEDLAVTMDQVATAWLPDGADITVTPLN